MPGKAGEIPADRYMGDAYTHDIAAEGAVQPDTGRPLRAGWCWRYSPQVQIVLDFMEYPGADLWARAALTQQAISPGGWLIRLFSLVRRVDITLLASTESHTACRLRLVS
jgi:hypothetical protein